MTDDRGLADLHIHTLASDGTSGVLEILERVEGETDLDVIAITDHERIDAAVAARALAVDHGLRIRVIVGEEISTRGGHLLGLFLTEPVPPLRSLRESIARVHDQGGIAIPAHPLVPYPLCAQGWVLRRLAEDADPRYRPDALEAFNPTMLGRLRHRQVVAFARALGLPAVGSSDAHAAELIGHGATRFHGRTEADLRRAIVEGTTDWNGTFHATGHQVSVFGRQLRKYGRDLQAGTRGRVLRTGTGRDLGYPGGTRRPPVFDAASARPLRARPRTDGDTGTAASARRTSVPGPDAASPTAPASAPSSASSSSRPDAPRPQAPGASA